MKEQQLREHTFSHGHVFQIVQGDITRQKVDGIVNAANSHLKHRGGVARIIARRGGGEVQAASDHWVREHGPVSHADPAHTPAGNLPCKYVIHAVGPVWGEGDEDAKLSATITGSLRRADKLKLKSLALPAISTGIFGFPKDRAARVIFQAIRQYFVENNTSSIGVVRLVLYDQPTLDTFIETWDSQAGLSNS